MRKILFTSVLFIGCIFEGSNEKDQGKITDKDQEKIVDSISFQIKRSDVQINGGIIQETILEYDVDDFQAVFAHIPGNFFGIVGEGFEYHVSSSSGNFVLNLDSLQSPIHVGNNLNEEWVLSNNSSQFTRIATLGNSSNFDMDEDIVAFGIYSPKDNVPASLVYFDSPTNIDATLSVCNKTMDFEVSIPKSGYYLIGPIEETSTYQKVGLLESTNELFYTYTKMDSATFDELNELFGCQSEILTKLGVLNKEI